MLVTCPSGFAFRIRKLKTKEMDILSDKQAAQKGVVLDNLLSSIWEETVDVGPYKFAGAPVWSKVLTGDRFYAHLHARIATFGDSYAFRIPCQHCKSVIEWELKLSALPVKKLSAADAQTFMSGNVFKVAGPDGKQYTFHLMTGEGERKAQQVLKSNPTAKATASLLARISDIEGVDDRKSYLEDLDLDLVQDLLKTLDSHDCGIDTDIQVSCSTCGAENDVQLPLAQKQFWSPTRKSSQTATK